MKSKLATIAVLASIACSGLPLQASPSLAELKARSKSAGFIATLQCHLNKGLISEARAQKILVKWLTDEPQYRDGAAWVKHTKAGNDAIQAVLPYFTADCKEVPKNMGELLYPFLTQ